LYLKQNQKHYTGLSSGLQPGKPEPEIFMARLTKKQWIEAEELYKQGLTQKELAEKFKIRPETISVHMSKNKVKGGAAVDVVRQEMQVALLRKTKEFSEKRAARQIDTKEKFHTLVNSVLGFFVKELKSAQDAGKGLDSIAGSAKSLKEALSGLKIAREELYAILEIQNTVDVDTIPELFVMPMSQEDEDKIRSSGAYMVSDDEPEPDSLEASEEALKKQIEELGKQE
jgi:predicted DNA-binding protein YlxM (UPF0122 family)